MPRSTVCHLGLAVLIVAAAGALGGCASHPAPKPEGIYPAARAGETPDGSLDLVATLFQLSYRAPVEWNRVARLCAYLDQRPDCADFAIGNLLRLLIQFGDQIPADMKDRIKATLVGFKYWIDEPGTDSMCYWSENHQIMFASSELLAGELFPDEVFPNAGLTGREHAARARARILAWLEARWKYGFSEWHSNVYYPVDVEALVNLVDFAADPEVASKAACILDVLMLDVAMHQFQGVFSPSQGRVYRAEEMHPDADSFKEISRAVWKTHYNWGVSYNMSKVLLLSPRYVLPDAIREIGADPGTAEIRTSMGLDIGEVVAEGLDLSLPETGMFLWGMEAFTDSRIIETTLRTIDAYGLQENGFFEDLNAPYIRAIRGLGLLKPVARMLNPVTNGVALQRADTYTYKTADYCLSTTQRYQPGFYADQQHVWRAVLSPQIAVFTTHPARPFSDSKYLNESPGYWVGSGRLPLAAQDRNVVLVMYRLPRSPGFMENGVMPFTHAYFPVRSFSEVVREPTRIYGRTGNTYIALIAGSELSLARLSEDDFVQSGRQTWWICELGSRSEDGSFEAFVERVRAQPAVFERGVLSYITPRGNYRLSWPEGLSLDGSPVRDRYERIESPWCSLKRGDRVLEASCNGMTLSIDFAEGSRVSR